MLNGCAMRNVEFCNRLCRLPEQELSAAPIVNFEPLTVGKASGDWQEAMLCLQQVGRH